MTWWFPIVGRVPYKGFFDFAAAQGAARALEAQGFDAYLRPSAAFSTLGFFNDPVLSTSLSDDSTGLVNTVVHELTHNTFWRVDRRCSMSRSRTLPVPRARRGSFVPAEIRHRRRRSDAQWADDLILARFWARTYQAIDSVYRAHPERCRGMGGRAMTLVYARAREDLVRNVGPQLRTIEVKSLPRVRLDNASLMARRIYLTDLDLFEGVFAREGGDARRTIARVIALARTRSDDPYAALRNWLSGGAGAAKAPAQ